MMFSIYFSVYNHDTIIHCNFFTNIIFFFYIIYIEETCNFNRSKQHNLFLHIYKNNLYNVLSLYYHIHRTVCLNIYNTHIRRHQKTFSFL